MAQLRDIQPAGAGRRAAAAADEKSVGALRIGTRACCCHAALLDCIDAMLRAVCASASGKELTRPLPALSHTRYLFPGAAHYEPFIRPLEASQ